MRLPALRLPALRLPALRLPMVLLLLACLLSLLHAGHCMKRLTALHTDKHKMSKALSTSLPDLGLLRVDADKDGKAKRAVAKQAAGSKPVAGGALKIRDTVPHRGCPQELVLWLEASLNPAYSKLVEQRQEGLPKRPSFLPLPSKASSRSMTNLTSLGGSEMDRQGPSRRASFAFRRGSPQWERRPWKKVRSPLAGDSPVSPEEPEGTAPEPLRLQLRPRSLSLTSSRENTSSPSETQAPLGAPGTFPSPVSPELPISPKLLGTPVFPESPSQEKDVVVASQFMFPASPDDSDLSPLRGAPEVQRKVRGESSEQVAAEPPGDSDPLPLLTAPEAPYESKKDSSDTPAKHGKKGVVQGFKSLGAKLKQRRAKKGRRADDSVAAPTRLSAEKKVHGSLVVLETPKKGPKSPSLQRAFRLLKAPKKPEAGAEEAAEIAVKITAATPEHTRKGRSKSPTESASPSAPSYRKDNVGGVLRETITCHAGQYDGSLEQCWKERFLKRNPQKRLEALKSITVVSNDRRLLALADDFLRGAVFYFRPLARRNFLNCVLPEVDPLCKDQASLPLQYLHLSPLDPFLEKDRNLEFNWVNVETRMTGNSDLLALRRCQKFSAELPFSSRALLLAMPRIVYTAECESHMCTIVLTRDGAEFSGGWRIREERLEKTEEEGLGFVPKENLSAVKMIPPTPRQSMPPAHAVCDNPGFSKGTASMKLAGLEVMASVVVPIRYTILTGENMPTTLPQDEGGGSDVRTPSSPESLFGSPYPSRRSSPLSASPVSSPARSPLGSPLDPQEMVPPHSAPSPPGGAPAGHEEGRWGDFRWL